jgi:hypothetical protein
MSDIPLPLVVALAAGLFSGFLGRLLEELLYRPRLPDAATLEAGSLSVGATRTLLVTKEANEDPGGFQTRRKI